MPDKKLTDSEIVNALQKEIQDSKRINSSYALFNLNLLKESVDLINRLQEEKEALINGQETLQKYIADLQAENKRLSTLAELGDKRANDYRVMRDRALKAEAENERLKSKLEPQGFEEADPMDFCGVLCDFAEGLIAKVKAEAYKEFAELLHCYCEGVINQEWNSKVAPISWAIAYGEFEDVIDYQLKEMVGE